MAKPIFFGPSDETERDILPSSAADGDSTAVMAARTSGHTPSTRAPASPQLEAFGRRLYSLMLAKGWRQAELARRADLPRDSVSTYIRGLVTPTPQSLKKLAQALGTTEVDLWPGYPDNTSVTPDASHIEMSIFPNSPNTAWLRINCQTSVSLAVKIIALLQENNDVDAGK